MHLEKGTLIMTETENLCVTAMEECAELSAELSKGLRFGFSSRNPVNNPNKKDTATQAILEFYHVEAMIELLIENGVLPKISKEDADKIKIAKKRKVEKYKRRSIRKRRNKPVSHLEFLRYEDSRVYFKTEFIDRLNKLVSKTDNRFELYMHVESEDDINRSMVSLDIKDTLLPNRDSCGEIIIEDGIIADIFLRIINHEHYWDAIQRLVDEYAYGEIVIHQDDYILMHRCNRES